MLNKKLFEDKIKPLLTYIGGISAIIISIMYIIAVIVLIRGFSLRLTSSMVVFALVNAIVGLLVLESLKIQGQSFAQHLPENEKLLQEYYGTKTKDKKIRSMKYFWVTSIIKDILIKGLTATASTICVIYIVIVGTNDWNLLLLAFCNLLLFIAFGLISLGKAYDFYNDYHIPYIKEQLKKGKENGQKETES